MIDYSALPWDPDDLLTVEEHQQLHEDLHRMATQRRRAEIDSAHTPMA